MLLFGEEHAGQRRKNRTDTRVEEIDEQGVRSTGGRITADTVVIAVGLKALDPNADSLREKIDSIKKFLIFR